MSSKSKPTARVATLTKENGTRRRQEAAGILAGCTVGRMDVAEEEEEEESPRPAEPALTFQRDGVRLAVERMSGLATRKEPEAEGSPIMDDRAIDGRGAARGIRRLGVEYELRSWPASRNLVSWMAR